MKLILCAVILFQSYIWVEPVNLPMQCPNHMVCV
jgi:hypothetical protein